MAVYDRAMFRGSRPKAAADAVGSMAGVAKQMAGPMVQQGIAGVMQDMTKGVKSAKNYEQAMNAFRGDQKSVGERRKELGGIVGMKDAKKTPESVLTLVQPVMEMREIKERSDVDKGIGQVAEKAMDTPVEGKMAQGIMQPLKLQPGGPVSLRTYYEKNLPIIQDIYGDTGAEARKDALGQFLLSAAAPAGLAVARGDMDIGEALMATLPVLAQTGAQAKAATRKEKLAQRDAALKMAISDQAAAREAAAAAKKVQFAPPGSSIIQNGKIIGRVAPKPAGYRTVYKLDLTQPLGYIPLEIPKDQKAPEGFSSDKPEVKSSQYYDKTTKKLVTIPDLLANQSERYVKPGDDSPIDAFDATGKKIKITMAEYKANPAAYFMEDPKATTDVYFNSAIDLQVDGVTKKFLPGVPYAILNSVKDSLPLGSYSTKKPADAKDEPQVTNVTPIEDIVFNDQILPKGQMVASLPRSFVQANSSKFKTKDQVAAETAAEVRETQAAADAKKTNDMTFLQDGTYQLPTGVEITVKEGETRPLTLAEQEAIRKQNPNAFGKKAEPKKINPITASAARANIEPLATLINETENLDELDAKVIREFEANLGAYRDRSGSGQIVVAGGILPEQPGVTQNVYQALKKITEYQTSKFRQATPEGAIPEGALINDFGVLAEPVPPKDPEFVKLVASVAGDFDTSNLGLIGAGKRAINSVSSVLTQVATGQAAIPFDQASSAIKTITALNDYSLGVYISSVGRQNATVVNSFINTQPKAGSLTQTPKEIAKSANLTATQLNNRAQVLLAEANALPSDSANIKKAANLTARSQELEAIASDYELLAALLKGQGSSSPGATTTDMESIFE